MLNSKKPTLGTGTQSRTALAFVARHSPDRLHRHRSFLPNPDITINAITIITTQAGKRPRALPGATPMPRSECALPFWLAGGMLSPRGAD